MSLTDVSAEPMPKLLPRAADSHKGDYGRVLVVGGSRGMAGAPALAGKAALRSGAGLVTLAVPRSIQATVAGFEPAYMTLSFGSSDDDSLRGEDVDDLLQAADRMSAIALGPGLGTASDTVGLVHDLYGRIEQPMVVDADGLNALAQDLEQLRTSVAPRILTPHPGEFQRLAGEKCAGDLAARAEQAAELCRCDDSAKTIVVLKGHHTIVTDGGQYAVNSTGNPGMATGGTGDCLTGVIVALLAQGLSPWEAARLGVHVHGLAGDLAAAALGQVSLTASDLIDFLPRAFLTRC
jgi:NAD(P)H-hydrate epimerase